MKRLLFAVLALMLATAGQAPAAPDTGTDLRLVVLIAVDQFRYDYLTRFRGRLHRTGFKRLLTEGAVFTDANLEHYPTVTAIGHSTMLSGATPSVSGIVGNDWFDRDTGATVTSVSDPTVKLLGSPAGAAAVAAAAARQHGRRRAEDGIAAAQGRRPTRRGFRRVVEGSIGDSARRPRRRCGVLVGYQDRAASSRARTTSPRFRTGCAAFNERKPADTHAGATWTRPVGAGDRTAAAAGRTRAALYEAVYGSPYGNDLLLDFASELLDRERLGTARTSPICSRSASPRTIRSGIPTGRLAAGARHRDPNRSDDRASAESGRQDRRAAAHAGRVHRRPRRRAAAGNAARARAARRTA